MRAIIWIAHFFDRWIPWLGHYLALVIDRLLLILYGVDLTSARVNVRRLSISHPGGVLLGDNVVIGTSTVLVGPIEICDNVIIGAMSLVNKSIRELGVYVGIPAVKIGENVTEEWVAHL